MADEPKRLDSSNVMSVDLRPNANVMQVMLVWPDFEFETVTVNGEVLTVDGEPVYVAVPD